jgi:prophage antirepressor-like protein
MKKFMTIEFFDKKLDLYGNHDDYWFRAVEISELIHYSNGNTSHMLRLVHPEDKLVVKVLRAGQRRDTWFINEDGLFDILSESTRPLAREYKRSIKQILREIRRGEYVQPVYESGNEIQGFYNHLREKSQIHYGSAKERLIELFEDENGNFDEGLYNEHIYQQFGN